MQKSRNSFLICLILHHLCRSNIYKSFNPDYIIKFTDGKIGIYEIKSFKNIEEQDKTNYKHIALLNYVRKNNLLGDIMYVNTKTGAILDCNNKIPMNLKNKKEISRYLSKS